MRLSFHKKWSTTLLAYKVAADVAPAVDNKTYDASGKVAYMDESMNIFQHRSCLNWNKQPTGGLAGVVSMV